MGSTFAGEVDVKTMLPVGFDRNTLYVGGSGSGNYTNIQDAITTIFGLMTLTAMPLSRLLNSLSSRLTGMSTWT
ncbi:unnamed protein product, partial [marine sediment metagenome]